MNDPTYPASAGHRRPLTIEEAAEYLGVGPRMVRRLIHERRIPYVKLGRPVRLMPEDLDAYLEARRVEARGDDRWQ